MRKLVLFCSIIATGLTPAGAQTVATFEDLTLPKPDTFYVNWATPMSDVGFNDGLAHFPCYYDTSWGGSWSSGFAYSNMTDSVTSGYGNEYSAKAAAGYGGSAEYAVAYCPASFTTGINTANLRLTGAAMGMTVSGFYVSNGTYAFNSMRSGDTFGKKFGGTTGNDPDWFKLTIKGMTGGAITADSVDFYLADYRFADNDSDYIVKTWDWVNLLPLGHVDSLVFMLRSSDTGMFGMNTPAYFCIDNFTTNETGVGVKSVANSAVAARIYPVPATDKICIETGDNHFDNIRIFDLKGVLVEEINNVTTVNNVNIANYPAGTYFVDIQGGNKHANGKFIKQ